MASKRIIDYLPDDPFRAIHEVWRSFGLDYALNELEYWFYMAMANRNGAFDDGEDRAEVVEFYFEFLYFIEAIYFYNEPRDTERIESRKKFSQEVRDFLESENQPRRLTDEAKENPVPLIEEFCQAFSIEHLRTVLWEFFTAVCQYNGEFKTYINPLGLHHMYLNFLTLVEAAHLIFKKE